MKKFLLLPALLMVLWCRAQTPSFITDSLDGYIEKGLKQWQIPGLAMVVVKDGKVVVQKGFGVRSLGGKPVDAHTLFMIASNTKLFTGTALALLETRGLLSLDDKVTRHFPDYRLYDTVTTSLVTIRDLLSHRIGTKTFQGDFTFWNTTLSREAIMQRMRLLRPSLLFRQSYGYCNSCYLTAGQVIPKVTGRSWEDFVRDSLLRPLEMNQTLVLSTGVAQQPNVAVPYTTSFTGTLQQVPYDNWNNLAPAASITSNVSDLAHWLQFQLDSGRYQGRPVLPWSVLQKTRDVNIITSSRKSVLLPLHFRGYGLGLFSADYNGRQIFWHTGGAGGMVSNVCFVPEERLGIAILTNNDDQSFFEALRYQLLDAYLGVPYQDRSQQYRTSYQEDQKAQLQEIAGWKKRIKNNAPELPLSAYAGTYSNELYGPITIKPEGKRLKISFGAKPDLWATLDYLDNGEWLLQYNNIEYGIFTIKFDIAGGRVRSVTTRQNEFVEYDPYTFVKQP
ncbi:serine hydrolase [Paraflavisolibacter sp. H34]|uniref:serine hydrolase n=1 Tax=Huijunlia imazamoxiresistens TaxID=3127457 RepID=UPI0030195E19